MGSPKNDRNARQRLRKQFLSWGMKPEEVELCIQQVKERQNAKRWGQLEIDAPLCTRAEYVRLLRKMTHPNDVSPRPALSLGEDYIPSDDKGYKPAYVDPVLTGVARATGETAKAVKRGKTVTKYQYDKNH